MRISILVVAICTFTSLSWASLLGAQPNVVLIISDDQAWTDYGFMGHDVIQTPNLDRLATESLLLTRGYVPSSLCRPSLMTMITGLYPHQHGVTGNDPPRGTERDVLLRFVRNQPTLPKLLQERGYLSLQTGKWWEGHYRLGGFTHGMTHGDPARRGRHGDQGLTIGREGLQPIFDFIETADERPFFVWYAPFMPHTPHTPPARLLEKYQGQVTSPFVARYYAMCEWFDESCGELLQFLDDQGLSDDTLVIYVTDNGWIQDPQSGRFAPKSKRSPYDGGIRTPMMLRWPGRIEPRRDEQRLVSSIDLAPTILAACNAPAPKQLPGINLLELSSASPPQRDTIFGEIFEHDVVDVDEPAAGLLYRWCIQDAWKLILPHDGESPELYNLAQDPMETQNLAAQQPDKVKRLTKRLNQWWSAE